MKVNGLKFKSLEVSSIEFTKQDIHNICIVVTGITAMIVLPTPSLKLKALTATMSALTLNKG